MRADDAVHSTRPTLTDVLRMRLKGFVEPIAAFLNRLGISPNVITITGLVGNFIGAMFLARGNFLTGGLIILAMGPMDALDGTMVGLVFAATVGSFMVPYARARAEGLGYQAKNGLLTRAERFVVLVPSLILNYPKIGIGIVAVLANLTAVQRIYAVHRQAHKK
jgi:CDP-diacylglycerol--glycerol-3-phosphate 3-phosphatidyltransferase